MTAYFIERQKVLVCCGAGMSRSPGVLAMALARLRNVSPENCLREIIAGQPHDVSPAFWQSLIRIRDA